jgi:small acid-soluble spore protein O (minor)
LKKTAKNANDFPSVGKPMFIKEVHLMAKRKSNHVIPGANAASSQGMGAGYNEEFSNEPLTEAQKQNNKKRKKNQ